MAAMVHRRIRWFDDAIRPKAFSIRNFFQFSPENSSLKSKRRKLIKWLSGTRTGHCRRPLAARKNCGSQSRTIDRQLASVAHTEVTNAVLFNAEVGQASRRKLIPSGASVAAPPQIAAEMPRE